MGQLRISREYRCDDDCNQDGCPGHTAILEFNSIANIYRFDDGQGQEAYLDLSQAKVLIEMFKFYSDTRADTVRVG